METTFLDHDDKRFWTKFSQRDAARDNAATISNFARRTSNLPPFTLCSRLFTLFHDHPRYFLGGRGRVSSFDPSLQRYFGQVSGRENAAP
jgi:hypothetical protein